MIHPGIPWNLRKAERVAVCFNAALAASFIGLFYFIAYRRLGFPSELEWLEGGILDTVKRVVDHQSIYVAPSVQYVPSVYTPGYYYVAALFSSALGVSFSTLRLVSVLATSGCLLVLFSFVQRSTGNWFAALLSCGLFCALYAVSDAWFDLARVDMLYVFFLLVAIYSSRRGWAVCAAVAFTAAFFTKQTALVLAVLVLCHEIGRPRKLLAGLGTFAVLVGFFSWWLDHTNQGWFQYYAAYLPAHQSWQIHKLAAYGLHDLADPLGIALIVIALATVFRVADGGNDRRITAFMLCTSIGMILCTLPSRLHVGGTANVTLPLFAWICALFGVSLHAVLKKAKEIPSLPEGLLLTVYFACAVQFAQLVYSPRPYVPTADQKKEAAQLLQRVSEVPGNVFVMHNVLELGTAGKPIYANSMAIWDLLRADRGPVAQQLRNRLLEEFEKGTFSAIVSDGGITDMYPEEVEFMQSIDEIVAAAYPRQVRLLSPSQVAAFYAIPVTPDVKPIFMFLRR